MPKTADCCAIPFHRQRKNGRETLAERHVEAPNLPPEMDVMARADIPPDELLHPPPLNGLWEAGKMMRRTRDRSIAAKFTLSFIPAVIWAI
ncbi:hypothetical protein QJS10_CPB15g00649 [Acorus calamus]|uniref:Uncharacterized protein n=1 Tax=Acorus calamus TaxID=4465 RepID=A0AAV9D9Q5_ACOCL|nr:hypothetical protein QJS10_CPB15g00649 [Acorus calamus]